MLWQFIWQPPVGNQVDLMDAQLEKPDALPILDRYAILLGMVEDQHGIV